MLFNYRVQWKFRLFIEKIVWLICFINLKLITFFKNSLFFPSIFSLDASNYCMCDLYIHVYYVIYIAPLNYLISFTCTKILFSFLTSYVECARNRRVNRCIACLFSMQRCSSIIESNVSFATHVFSVQSFRQTTHIIWFDNGIAWWKRQLWKTRMRPRGCDKVLA